MDDIAQGVRKYIDETRRLSSITGTNEETFYPAIRELLASVLRSRDLPFDVRTGTSEARHAGINRPDFVFGDPGSFVAVFGEVKLPDTNLDELAASTERDDQIGRYLAQTGVVLVSNVRAFGLVVCRATYKRVAGAKVPPSDRELIASADLWGALTGKGAKAHLDESVFEAFAELVERSVTDYAPIADPADLAKILARQARDAKAALPDDLKAVESLLDDYRQALGLSFDIADEKGDRFFRSSLIQTAFYSLFAAWVLWDRSGAKEAFDLDTAQSHLHIPFLEELFYDIRHPTYLRSLNLGRHLERAVGTLNRVDREAFRTRMKFPAIDDKTRAAAAITYFYEPFLEAFDPALREDLGVWYTPPEIVQYQVRRVHHILKTELRRPRGLADQDVVVLDPCCGTGAYLLEVARCIAEELKNEGDDSVVGMELLRAFETRVLGFEILTAPFAIAQLQLYILLAQLGAAPPAGHRLGVYLTNSLTGWRTPGNIKITFPEMRQEFDLSQSVKHSARIIVMLGNPPYDRFSGVALAEEGELVAHYKGVELIAETGRDGVVKEDEFGRPRMKQRGQSGLYEEFGVRKQLLDDLYVRFFRLAEERIGEAASYGVVSYISNSSYLAGRSHPIMRRSLLTNFHKVWIDNLNGDKFKTGKVIPDGMPGEGTTDQSIFTTELDSRGIQPGTAIATWLKRQPARGEPSQTEVQYRDLWGLADGKRAALLSSLPSGGDASDAAIPRYEPIRPTRENRWRLSPHQQEAGYESWPAVDELFPVAYQGVNHNRGIEGSVIDTSRLALESRIEAYFSASSFAAAAQACPGVAEPRARYNPESVWKKIKGADGYKSEQIRSFLTFPFDQRWLYYEPEHKWLNEARPEFGVNLESNEFFITVPEPRKVSETRPLFATTLVNLHVHERGSVVFPRESGGGDMIATRDANIPEATWRIVRQHFALSGVDRHSAEARGFVGRLFRAALAIMYAPRYQADHKSALSADWAHLPLPRDAALFERLVAAGSEVASVLDCTAEASEILNRIVGADRNTALAQIQRSDGAQVQSGDLMVAVNYWGGSRGRWVPRPYAAHERSFRRWGDRTGDLYIGEQVFFGNVPEAVWTYEIGGYPVLKKWLGYRQADRRDGQPLSPDERRWFKSIVQRIAALLALEETLDVLYGAASTCAFTASDLEIQR